MKILFAGGGTAGPVAPLIALAEELTRDHGAEVLFVVSEGGADQRLVQTAGQPSTPMRSGKLDRFWSVQNLLAPLYTTIAFYTSIGLIRRFRPDVAVGAGGFLQVPVLLAAWVMRVPVHIHQQDAQSTLSNRILRFFAKEVTVTFSESLVDFPGAAVTGNPCRITVLPSQSSARSSLGIPANAQVLLVLGGGSGALALNTYVAEHVGEITQDWYVLHSTGAGKAVTINSPHYVQVPFIADMEAYLAAADAVLCRPGMGTLGELSVAKKASILVPMPGTHQEKNAALFVSRNAGLAASQNTPSTIQAALLELTHGAVRERLASHAATVLPSGATQIISSLLVQLASGGAR